MPNSGGFSGIAVNKDLILVGVKRHNPFLPEDFVFGRGWRPHCYPMNLAEIGATFFDARVATVV